MPSPEEAECPYGRHNEHSGVFSHKEEPVSHSAVFGRVTGYKLSLRLGQVKGNPVRLGKGSHEEDEKSYKLG